MLQMLLEVMSPKLSATDRVLLLRYSDNLLWASLLPVLSDVSLHIAVIRDKYNMPLARLLLEKAVHQLGLTAATVAAAHNGPGTASTHLEAATKYSTAAKRLFANLLCHDYVATLTPEVLTGMITLGLRTDKVNGEQQPLLHRALADRCSTPLAMLLLNRTPPEVMLHEDASHTYPLHYVAALPDLHEPNRMELLKAACDRWVSGITQ